MSSKASDTPAGSGAEGESAAGSGGRLQGAAETVRDAASSAKAAAADALGAVKEKSGAAYSAALDRTSEAYGSARDKAGQAYGAARERASAARQTTAEGIEDNPFVAVLGGIAVGLLVGALLPRSRREADLLAPVADRLAGTVRNAAAAAKDAGRQTLDELGVNADAARGQVEKIVDTAVKAASSAGTAAADAVRQG